jgi:hypothetical protein
MDCTRTGEVNRTAASLEDPAGSRMHQYNNMGVKSLIYSGIRSGDIRVAAIFVL